MAETDYPTCLKQNNLPRLQRLKNVIIRENLLFPDDISLEDVLKYVIENHADKSEHPSVFSLNFKLGFLGIMSESIGFTVDLNEEKNPDIGIYAATQVVVTGKEYYAKHYYSGANHHYYAQLLDPFFDHSFWSGINYAYGGGGPLTDEKADSMRNMWKEYADKYPINRLFHIENLECYFTK